MTAKAPEVKALEECHAMIDWLASRLANAGGDVFTPRELKAYAVANAQMAIRHARRLRAALKLEAE